MKIENKPPRLGLRILKTFFDEEDFFELSSDIKEEYYIIASDKGVRRARTWYWRQILKSLPALAKDKVNGILFFLKKNIFRRLIPVMQYKITVNLFAISLVTAANISFFTVTCSKSPTQPNFTLPVLKNEVTRNTRHLSKITFFSERGGHVQVYTVKEDGSNLKKLSKASREDFDPSWSSDGSKIVFSSGNFRDRDGSGKSNIFIMNANGSNRKQITFEKYHDRNPSWSPDGKKIAFDSYRYGNWDIFVMNADGSDLTQLTHSYAHDIYPSWSPNGKKILFVTERHYPNGIKTEASDNWEIYILNVDGSDKKRLTINNASDSFPIFSPDGSQILYTSNLSGKFNVYKMNIDGSNKRQLTFSEKESVYATSWSEDGAKITYYSGTDGEDYNIFVMNADGSNPINITPDGPWSVKPRWCPKTK